MRCTARPMLTIYPVGGRKQATGIWLGRSTILVFHREALAQHVWDASISRYGPYARTEVAERGSAEHLYGVFSWMDAGCLRFFSATVCLRAIAADFHTGIKQIAEAIFWTLVMRPLGALIFGMMAERFGRRPTLIWNIVCFSVFELASAFAPTLKSFLVCRALFGIAMGGEWGVGQRRRAGVAAVFPARTVLGHSAGGRCGGEPDGGSALRPCVSTPAWTRHADGLASDVHDRGAAALLAFYMQFKVTESPIWVAAKERQKAEGRGAGRRFHFARF